MRPCAIISSFGIDSLCCKMKVWTYTSWICFKPWRLPATLYKHQPRPRFKHSLHPKLPGRSSIHASEWHALQGTFCLSRAMEAGKAIAVSAHNLLGTGQLLTTESGQPPATEVSKLRSPVWRDRGSGMLLRSSGNGLSTQCHHPRREQSDCVRSQAGTTHTELVGGTESNAVPCCSPYRHTMHFRKSFHQEAEQEPEGSSSHRREDRRALICSRLFRESVQSSGNQERPLVSSIQKEHQRTWQRSQLGAIS